MKVLFAVHDEKVSLSIVKKFQKEYKEIISYKNVYYFNAILKELQRDKTYDRIVIDEELEEFTSTSYEEKDKFIFNKLDSITDEASNSNGTDVPIILICSDRRAKSEDILVKLFGIGIYNAIIGNDRSTDEVCRLLSSPRSKKDAKVYYKINSKDVDYDPERENDVSEEEMQHILSYFKKLGKNEDQYVEAFNKIVTQYNNEQMKVIMAILPINVKAVLEARSVEYQRIALTTGNKMTSKAMMESERFNPTSEKLLNSSGDRKNGSPVVVPSSIDKNLIKKVAIRRPTIEKKVEDEYLDDFDDEDEDNDDFEDIEDIDTNTNEKDIKNENLNIDEDSFEDILDDDFKDLNEENEEKEEIEETVPTQKRRGRPRKTEKAEETSEPVKKKRGRPSKKAIVEDEEEDNQTQFSDILPGFDEDNFEDVNEEIKPISENLLGPDFNNFDDDEDNEDEGSLDSEFKNPFDDINDNNLKESDTEEDDVFDYDDEEESSENQENQDDNNIFDFDDNDTASVLPGTDSTQENEEEDFFNPKPTTEYQNFESQNKENDWQENTTSKEIGNFGHDVYEYDYTRYNSLLSSDRKVIAFVGTSKNGTSFIVNNVAKILSDNGIDTAILDATQNKNSYYIYNNNDDTLRTTAANSINSLINGEPNGMRIATNLSVYVEVPGETDTNMNQVGPILENLIRQHSAVLIDCDFNTPFDYFERAQEIYLVQSMDVLTIQPLTAFLKELKNRNILDQNKLKIIINKVMKLRGIGSKQIVGGMSNYNNPEMSIMTELFDRNLVTPIEIPFDIDVYARYLEGLAECDISINKYPKEFQAILKKLVSVIYPLLPGNTSNKSKKGYQYEGYSNAFSNSVNNTLNNMKKKY